MTTGRTVLLIAVAALTAAARSAHAQDAPAGNAHPAGSMFSTETAPNPLGVGEPSGMTPQEKHAFARRVDLSPLRSLAVHHNGRVKTLDTLAREVVRAVTGRGDYLDLVPETNDAGAVTGVRKLRYDPLFTFIDLLADPVYYTDKPLVHVGFLPARRALIEASVSDPEQVERWMRLTRLSPALIAAGFAGVARERGTDPQIAEALGSLREVGDLLRLGHTTLRLAAPAPGSDRWRHVSELEADAPARSALTRLGDAWRAGDAESVTAAARQAAVALSALNEGAISPTRLRAETLYNRVQPFEFGAWAYAVALVALLFAFGTGWRWAIGLGAGALIVAVSLHAAGFAARWWIAERLPIQNQFESMTGLALGAALAGLAMTVVKRQWLFGAAASAAGFLILLAATQTAIPGQAIGREAAILNTSWLLKYHVSTVLVSYGLITLGAVMSAFYLAVHYLGRGRDGELAGFAATGLNLDASAPAGRRRLLGDLDRAQMTVLQLAFWALGVGILLGAWWADHSWGRWWAFDPKETWALLTWIVYLIVIHVRLGVAGDRGLVTAWLSILGFGVMIWTYFGVNLLLPGLHAYA